MQVFVFSHDYESAWRSAMRPLVPGIGLVEELAVSGRRRSAVGRQAHPVRGRMLRRCSGRRAPVVRMRSERYPLLSAAFPDPEHGKQAGLVPVNPLTGGAGRRDDQFGLARTNAAPAGVPRVARPVSMRGPLPSLTELPETLGADLGHALDRLNTGPILWMPRAVCDG